DLGGKADLFGHAIIIVARGPAVLYVLGMDGTAPAARPAGTEVAAWRPTVAGITEVLHARFIDHAYPLHTHDAWALLIVDDGVIRYDIDRRERGVVRPLVALLPPDVP